MKDNSLYTLGGLCAIIIAIASLITGVVYLIMPADLQAGVPAPRFLPAFAQDATMLLLVFWLQALIGILGVAVVPAVSERSGSAGHGWLRWTSNLAMIGFAASAIGYLLSAERLPRIAAAFVAGDAATKAALGATWKASIDLFGIWGYGVVGLWVLVVSLLALRGTGFPRNLNYLGLLTGVLYILIPLGTIFKVSILLTVSAGLGSVVALIWYGWIGMQLRRPA